MAVKTKRKIYKEKSVRKKRKEKRKLLLLSLETDIATSIKKIMKAKDCKFNSTRV